MTEPAKFKRGDIVVDAMDPESPTATVLSASTYGESNAWFYEVEFFWKGRKQTSFLPEWRFEKYQDKNQLSMFEG